jgi:hypothetical protein
MRQGYPFGLVPADRDAQILDVNPVSPPVALDQLVVQYRQGRWALRRSHLEIFSMYYP